ncbi:MAG: glycoside hydrolase family 5 protein [Defluviitaleaceae bacterium]|nr:glycoside hydrolase family 5 protein [Defluviitaleaceae bacterium]
MRKAWIFFTLLILSVVVLAACGSNEDAPPIPEQDEVAYTPPPETLPPQGEPPLATLPIELPPQMLSPQDFIPAPATVLTHAPAIRTFDLPAIDFARAMGVGWNLGNSMDAFSNRRASETAWNNPRIEPALFHALREAGFTNVRIPVTWIGHIDDDNDFAISEAWMNRVEEVVNYALDADLYVVINIHHDGNNYFAGGAWLSIEQYPDGVHTNWTSPNVPDPSDFLCQETIQARFVAIWAQIAERFRDYDARLLFEGFNELRELGNYNNPLRATSMPNLNTLNQLFVDTVRTTGGNNAYRYLIVAGYNTNAGITMSIVHGFQIPTDTAPYRLMLSIHYYDPWLFSLNTNNHTIIRWGDEVRDIRMPGVDSWGNESHVRNIFGQLYDTFISRGIPIYMGEYGAHDKSTVDPINREYRRHWMEYVTRAMIDYGMVPVIWDNGNFAPSGGERFGIMDRRAFAPRYNDLVYALVRAPYAPARPLFSMQMLHDTFYAYIDNAKVLEVFEEAMVAAHAFRTDMTRENLYIVEELYRELFAAIHQHRAQ